MKHQIKTALSVLTSVGTLTTMTVGASAAVGCNHEGVCWHTNTDYNYKPEFSLSIHPNEDWKWNQNEKHSWREHDGRGYWQGDVWKQF